MLLDSSENLYFCCLKTNCSSCEALTRGGNGSFRLPLFEGYRSIIASSIPKRINVFTADVY